MYENSTIFSNISKGNIRRTCGSASLRTMENVNVELRSKLAKLVAPLLDDILVLTDYPNESKCCVTQNRNEKDIDRK